MRGDNTKAVRQEHLLKNIAALLEAPRDRFGRLEPTLQNGSHQAREAIRNLAVEYGVGAARDTLEQVAKVIRHTLTLT